MQSLYEGIAEGFRQHQVQSFSGTVFVGAEGSLPQTTNLTLFISVLKICVSGPVEVTADRLGMTFEDLC